MGHVELLARWEIVFLALIISFLGFVPLGMAAQRMITDASLDKAYSAQEAVLESQIQVSQKNINNETLSKKGIVKSFGQIGGVDSVVNTENSNIQKAKSDEHILGISYQLMKVALQ